MKKKKYTPFFLIIPFLIFFFVFWLIPFIWGFKLSFESNDLINQSKFVGFSNYINVLKDGKFYKSLINNSIYFIGISFFLIPFSISLAFLIKVSTKKLRSFTIFSLILSKLVPPTTLGILFLLLFSSKNGIINNIFLFPLNLPAISWFNDPFYIKIALIFQGIWKWLGVSTLFIYTALDNIPKTYYSLAQIEGLTKFKTFRIITLPQLKKSLFFILFFLWIDSFVLFNNAYTLLGNSGGPKDSALMLINYIYLTGFSYGYFGFSTAMSFLFTPILFVFTWFIYSIYSKRNEY